MSSEKRKTEDSAAGAPSSKRGRWDSDGAAPAPAAAANGTNGTVLDPQSTRAKIEAAKAKLAKAKEMLANRQKGAAVRSQHRSHPSRRTCGYFARPCPRTGRADLAAPHHLPNMTEWHVCWGRRSNHSRCQSLLTHAGYNTSSSARVWRGSSISGGSVNISVCGKLAAYAGRRRTDSSCTLRCGLWTSAGDVETPLHAAPASQVRKGHLSRDLLIVATATLQMLGSNTCQFAVGTGSSVYADRLPSTVKFAHQSYTAPATTLRRDPAGGLMRPPAAPAAASQPGGYRPAPLRLDAEGREVDEHGVPVVRKQAVTELKVRLQGR